jgi:hypothetical protein
MSAAPLPAAVRLLLREIKPNPDNPRVIRDEQFTRLVASLKSFPEMLALRPIVVNAERVVLGGNMRLRAAKEAGLKEVPVLIADQLTPEQQREFIVKDNASFGAWDWDVLANEWGDVPLADWGVDVPSFELEAASEKPDADAIPEPPPQPITQPGDLWILGTHRLLCGDSTNELNVAQVVENRTVGAVIFDPPFENTQLIAHHYPVIDSAADVFVFGDCMNNTAARLTLPQKWQFGFVWDGVTRWIVPGRPLIAHKTCDWFSGVGKYDHTVRKDPREPRTEVQIGTNKRGTYRLEPDLEGKCLASVFRSPVTAESHGAEHSKPVLWIEMLLGNCSSGLIVDLFCGSGTSLIAAEGISRSVAAVEMNPRYCDVIVRRWEEFTGQTATRITAATPEA